MNYIDPIEQAVRNSIEALPPDCRNNMEFGHEWVPVYQPHEYGKGYVGMSHTKTYQWPYYLCKHCYAVSSNFTDTYPSHIKRVR